jgi:hypothetical protein
MFTLFSKTVSPQVTFLIEALQILQETGRKVVW